MRGQAIFFHDPATETAGQNKPRRQACRAQEQTSRESSCRARASIPRIREHGHPSANTASGFLRARRARSPAWLRSAPARPILFPHIATEPSTRTRGSARDSKNYVQHEKIYRPGEVCVCCSLVVLVMGGTSATPTAAYGKQLRVPSLFVSLATRLPGCQPKQPARPVAVAGSTAAPATVPQRRPCSESPRRPLRRQATANHEGSSTKCWRVLRLP